ncbi:hypothetical protein MC7420_4995 [Coleofasciculus chthonoplastes PCC 7420]|uniref:Uncharacterized protein n=1 Tax=Coleofasciculus chthonoplastes PCC 7420 TaxID=118168 RepID=B4VZH4_9CYAN|nr:hypothetical protein MC7420_4995 [Coleofasciculus chthonoplastes PCC 7420]
MMKDRGIGAGLVTFRWNVTDLSWVRSRHFSARSAKALTTNSWHSI